ncbi:methyltransferase, FxLD system [Amycolatopsis taiwanensis]|uniref:methyltransferase, FxLD system n=1 Tax=Amycolatopsis taiwanensis TaxID=342230 RepID=UPI0025578AB8|nr:methyltransferase, FxLD system [Amycolatopsis taiwanensis]
MSTSSAALRKELVRRLRDGVGMVDERVLGAFETVPRHLFLPEIAAETAYQDEAIVTKRDVDGQAISSSSQPAMMALMLDQLGLAPGHRVLEIGAGTGYNAALMYELVSPGGEVVSVDIDADLVAGARENLASAGCRGVDVVCADGVAGHPERAPYDRIIATVGVWDLAPAWLDQLAPGGRIVAPLDLGGPQRSVAFDAVDGYWAGRSALPCGFMRLRGAFAGPERTDVLDCETGLTITLPRGGSLDRQAVLAAFTEPPVRRDSEVTVDSREVFGGLGLWLAIRGSGWCTLSESAAARRSHLSELSLSIGERWLTAGFSATDSLALLGRQDTLTALGYGPRGAELATALAGEIRAWDAAGRPGGAGLRVDAFPASTSDSVIAAHSLVRRRKSRRRPRPDPARPDGQLGESSPIRPSGELADRYVLDKTHTRLVLSFT